MPNRACVLRRERSAAFTDAFVARTPSWGLRRADDAPYLTSERGPWSAAAKRLDHSTAADCAARVPSDAPYRGWWRAPVADRSIGVG